MDSNGSKSYRVREVSFGDGYQQVAGDGINTPQEDYKIKWVGDIQEAVEIISFLDEHAGFKPFVLDNPLVGEGVYLVDKYSYNPLSKTLYTITFTAKQAYL